MRSAVLLVAAIAVTAAGGAMGAAPQDSPALALEVSTRARHLRPGEVVLLTVTPSRPLASLEGQAFGRSTGFWKASGSDGWQTLVAIPLDILPGSYAVGLRAADVDGVVATRDVPLRVGPVTFATRRLRVDARFVDPPASATGRILREAQVLKEMFERVRPGRLWTGPFDQPVPGPATSSFGRLTILNGRPQGRHQGADFRAADGTPVRSPNAGEIVLAEDLYYSGNTVVVDHGEGLYSLVAHLSRVTIAAGDRVERRELLGESGATGRVTGPHLHWAVRLRGATVDPLSLVVASAQADDRTAAGR